jgi:alpha-D-ribose 1-methylphosphonate 5-triphosphate diphosphatase
MGVGEAEIDAFIAHQKGLSGDHAVANRAMVAALCRRRDLPLASHDDATLDHIEEARAFGATLAEFPTTLEAARAARAHGLRVVAGAPNLVRGGSHSGNVSVHEIAAVGLVDILSSDYVPTSLV